jgi:hypothetical protein
VVSDQELKMMGETAMKLVAFGKVVAKVRDGAKADANIQLNRDECLSLIWGMQLLRTGVPDGQS